MSQWQTFRLIHLDALYVAGVLGERCNGTADCSNGSEGQVGCVHVMKTCGRVEVQLHSSLTSALVGGEWPTLRPSRSIPFDRRLAGPQSCSGRFGEERNLSPLQGMEPRIVQPVAWSLYRLVGTTGCRWKCSVLMLVNR